MQEESGKARVSTKKQLISWLLVVVDIYFFIMLAFTTLKGAGSGTSIVFLLIALGILAYPAYILLMRSGLINKIVFVLVVLILFTPYVITSKIRGYGDDHYDGDIMGLVPGSVAAVVELRDLDVYNKDKKNKLHEIVDFTQKLGSDSIYLSSLETNQAKKFFGEDNDTLKALDPIKKVTNEFETVKAQLDNPQLDTLSSIFGKFDIEKDLLSKELIFAIAPKDGAFPESKDARQYDDGAVRVAPNKYRTFEHPQSTFMMLTRVSEKIKIYLNLDSYALDYVQIPGVSFKIISDYREVTIQDQNLKIYYSLYEDVLAITTEERLMRQYVSLCDKQGRDNSSFLRSNVYETTQKLYKQDNGAKGDDLWGKAHLRLNVNMEELTKLSNIQYILNVPDEILMTEAGEFIFRLVDELLKSLFDMQHLAGATMLLNFDNTADSGLVLNMNSYCFYDNNMPGVLAATYSMAPRKPALRELVSDRVFGYFEIDKDLQQFNDYLSSQTLNYNLTPTLGEVLLGAVGEFVSDKLCLFFRPQELFKESGYDEELGAPPFTPLWAIGAGLSDLGQQQDYDSLARNILSNLIPEHQRATEQQLQTQFRFPISRVGDYEIRTIEWLNPETGENRIPILLTPFFGPQVDPAIAIVDKKYMIVSTSKEMLEEMLDGKINNTFRLNTDDANFGDLGALEQKFNDEPVNITGRLDVRDFLANFFTKMNIQNLAKAYSPEEPAPSMQKSWRESAERSAEYDGRKGDEKYIEELYQQRLERYMKSNAAERDNFVRDKLDSREFFKLISQVGFSVKSINQKNGFKLKIILTLGTQTEH